MVRGGLVADIVALYLIAQVNRHCEGNGRVGLVAPTGPCPAREGSGLNCLLGDDLHGVLESTQREVRPMRSQDQARPANPLRAS